jgi:hypothetical protein
VSYTEVYRIVTRSSGVESFAELDPSTSEAEALAAWEFAQRVLPAKAAVTLVRVATLTIASASRG